MIVPVLGMKSKSTLKGRRASLADALFTRTQQRVLGVLFGEPGRSFHASDVIRRAGTGSGAGQRELSRLEGSGLITATRVGNQKHYQVNQASPLFEEVHGIISKTVGLAEPLRQALSPLARRVRAAFVFGSVAGGRDRAQSDIDLMLISDDLSYGEVFGALERAAQTFGRQVNPTVYSSSEFSKRKKQGNAFATKVLKLPKIWVIGSADDLPA